MKFADITNDIAFLKIFRNDTKKKTLISFLNAVIDLPGNEQIIDIEIIKTFQLGQLSGGNSTIVDVKAKDEKGNTFIVEIQVPEFDFFHKRILYYTSQGYVSQIDKGVQYDKLSPVYFIGILEFEIGQNPNYFSRHKVLDIETKEQIIQDVEFNFIELPKFNKTIDQLETSIDQWTFFIKNAENLTLIPENVKDEGLKEAYTEANQQNWTKLELEDYMRALIKERDEIGRLEFAVRKAEKSAEIRGEIKGEIRGLLKVAKNMSQKGFSKSDIMEFTGLSEAELEDI